MAGVGEVLVGRVMKAHGIRGEVSIQVHTDHLGRFAPGSELIVDDAPMIVASSRPHQDRMLVRFEQVVDRNGAEALQGATVMIDEGALAPLGDDSYYPHQLVGLRVLDVAGVTLGTLAAVEESPAHDLWVVATSTGRVLVPAVKQIVVSVDLDAGVITLDPPAGLF